MYMSPELVRGHQYNEKVDVFSFSIIMYEVRAASVSVCVFACVCLHVGRGVGGWGRWCGGGGWGGGARQVNIDHT